MKTTNIYTDGACSQNGTWSGGAGVYVEQELGTISAYMAETETTNNIMEMKAFLYALKLVHSNVPNTTIVNIHSDSAYVINTLKKRWYVGWINRAKDGVWQTSKKEPVKNQEIWEEILKTEKLLAFHTINIIKVKAHSGIKGNEMADKLAVKGKILGQDIEWRVIDEL